MTDILIELFDSFAKKNPWIFAIVTAVIGVLVWELFKSLYFQVWGKTHERKYIQRILKEAEELLETGKYGISLETYNRVITSRNKKHYPLLYSKAQIAIGNVHQKIAKINQTEDSYETAIMYYKYALEIFAQKEYTYIERAFQNKIKYPDDFIKAKIELARAYAGLSLIRSKEENLIRAIDETTDILTIFSDRLTPSADAVIKNNLGTYYGDLSGYQNKERNLQIAMNYLEQASNYYKSDNLKLKEYFETTFNMAHLLVLLSASSKDINHLHKAIDYYNLLLSRIEKINNRSNIHSAVNDGLGTAYVELARLDQKNIETTLEKALHTFEEALKYTTRERKVEIARIKQNQARAYIELSKIKDPNNNIVVAINLLNDALKIYTIAEYPYLHAYTQITKSEAINNIIDSIPDIRLKMSLLNEVHVGLCDAKTVFTLDKFPEQNKKVENLICIINTKIIFPLIPYSIRTIQ